MWYTHLEIFIYSKNKTLNNGIEYNSYLTLILKGIHYLFVADLKFSRILTHFLLILSLGSNAIQKSRSYSNFDSLKRNDGDMFKNVSNLGQVSTTLY
jgi:hypothetical protein